MIRADRIPPAAFVLVLLAAAASGRAHAQSGASAGPNWLEERQELVELGRQHDSAWALYKAFEEQADDTTIDWTTIPDWSGLWEREAAPFHYDPDAPSISERIGDTPFFVPTARLKGRYKEMMDEIIENARRGNVYDPVSECGVPRGYPGVLRNPRPWEFAINPHQTWILTEAQNEVRRIYTDGRGHPPEEFAFPSQDGDTIGFWDGDRLITHTTDVKAHWVSRMQPHLSDALEGVERWQKVDSETMQADVWLYDSKALEEPWYTRQIYKKHEPIHPSKPLRIHFWECADPNNQITRTEEGGSTFTDFDFTEEDDDLYTQEEEEEGE